MGMGEPFANYERWWQSVERLHDPRGFNLGARSLTVSTVGLAPGIRRLAGEALPINLAISLHSPDDALRSEMMPINRRYPIAALMDATRDYIAQTHRRVSFEYVLLQGKNDRPEQATALAELLQGMLCHVNLIPWNPVPGAPLGRSDRARVLRFQRELVDRGIACTVRVERGMSIAGACGQLAGVTTGDAIPLVSALAGCCAAFFGPYSCCACLAATSSLHRRSRHPQPARRSYNSWPHRSHRTR